MCELSNIKKLTDELTKPKKVLVVEDDVNLLMSFEESLSGVGFEVLTSTNGGDAIKILEEFEVDLVVLDAFLPILNGVDVLNKIKSLNKQPFVAAITGWPGSDLVRKMLDVGVTILIPKPINPYKFSVAVVSILK